MNPIKIIINNMNCTFTSNFELYKKIESVACACKAIGNKLPMSVFIDNKGLSIQMKEEKTGRSLLYAFFLKEEFESYTFTSGDFLDDNTLNFNLYHKDLFACKFGKMNVSWVVSLLKPNVIELKVNQKNDKGLIVRERLVSLIPLENKKLNMDRLKDHNYCTTVLKTKDLLNELNCLGTKMARISVNTRDITQHYLNVTEIDYSEENELKSKNMILIPVNSIETIGVNHKEENEDKDTVDIEFLIKVIMKLKVRYKEITIEIPNNKDKPLCIQFGNNVVYYLVRRT